MATLRKRVNSSSSSCLFSADFVSFRLKELNSLVREINFTYFSPSESVTQVSLLTSMTASSFAPHSGPCSADPSIKPDFQAVILAAGKGSRFTEVTRGKAKCFLPVGPVPLIWFPINMLRKAGFKGE